MLTDKRIEDIYIQYTFTARYKRKSAIIEEIPFKYPKNHSVAGRFRTVRVGTNNYYEHITYEFPRILYLTSPSQVSPQKIHNDVINILTTIPHQIHYMRAHEGDSYKMLCETSFS